MALVLATISFQAASAAAEILGFGDGSDWVFAQRNASGLPRLANDVLTLTDPTVGTGHSQSTGAFYRTKVSIEQFTATFTYQALRYFDKDLADGFTFVVHNHFSATQAPGGVMPYGLCGGIGSGVLGYATDGISPGVNNSVAVAVNLRTTTPPLAPLYPGVVLADDSADDSPDNWDNDENYGPAKPSGFPTNPTESFAALTSEHPIAVRIVYDGTTLTATFRDTINGDTYLRSFGTPAAPLDIPNLVRQDDADQTMAWIGFTAGTCPNDSFGCGTSTQLISDFTFRDNAVPEPSAIFALMGIAVAGLGVRLGRRRSFSEADGPQSKR